MSNIARYANGHLFSIYSGTERTELVKELARVLGDVNDKDWANFDKFAERSRQLGALALERNCKLYVDAE
jgi:hypothetical protein